MIESEVCLRELDHRLLRWAEGGIRGQRIAVTLEYVGERQVVVLNQRARLPHNHRRQTAPSM